jgi:hypothetical protein
MGGLFVLATAACNAAPVPRETLVRTAAELQQAVQQAKPGTRIRIAPGDYQGPFYFAKVHGAAGKPIILVGSDPKRPPRILGRGECMHFSGASHLELQHITFQNAANNGLNIDDGGDYDTPSHHVTLRNLRVSDVGQKGNRDAIKLSGLDDFLVQNCLVERWGDGGSGIDMVGCHRGKIIGCVLRQGGADGVQAKGGSSEILLRDCRMEDYGERGVNIGGSTGLEFFRPKVAQMPADRRYEARDIRIENSLFIGGTTPFAFVGVEGAVVRRNTVYHPKRWALRILQETREPGFVPCRNGRFEENIVVFRSDQWFEGGVNIGSATAPQTFQFARNVWFCSDRPERSRPTLPTPERDALIGQNPRLRDPQRGDFNLAPDSPAAGRGATLPARKDD